MNVYIYGAQLWCEDCGEKIREQLTREGKAPADPDDEYSYDSDDFPKGPIPDGGGEADSPHHCAADDECLNAESLTWRGAPVNTVGGETQKIGGFLHNPLTRYGVEYLCEMVAERDCTDYQKALHKLWLDHYRDTWKREIADGVREIMKAA